MRLKPLSVTTNVVGLQNDTAGHVGHVGHNSSNQMARVVGLQTVVVTETRFNRAGLRQAKQEQAKQ